ncbi:MAG: hypothetical protein KatS3mg064_2113 [Tepidiforma sp.]|nr:MAG: hypothetical protein KatS3mg064_2113 [Tepidiforma sp.]
MAQATAAGDSEGVRFGGPYRVAPVPARSPVALLLPGAAIGAVAAFTASRFEGTAAFADPGWDRHYYLEAARAGPWNFHIAPYCWRVLVPLLAWAAPLPLQWTFLAAAFAGAFTAGAATWRLLRSEGHPPGLAAAGVLLLFATGWGLRYQLADFWLPDAAASGAIALCLLFAARGQPRAFAAALFAGALAKESALIAAPLALAFADRLPGSGRRRLVTGALAPLPGVAAAVLVRVAIPAWNDDAGYVASLPPVISRFPEIVAHYDYRSLLREVGWEQRVLGFDGGLARALTFGTFGPLTAALALAGAAAKPRLAARLAPVLLLAWAQLLVARDTERLVAMAAPAVCWLAVEGAGAVCRRGFARPADAALAAAGAFALALANGREAFGLDLAAQGLLAGGVLAALAFRRGFEGARPCGGVNPRG